MIIERKCPNCGKEYNLVVESDEHIAWVSGMKVQEVWPHKTPEQREQLITGMCSNECWNDYLGVDDSDA